VGDDAHCRLGVLALGDSITNGGGELQWGVALQSWALWTARGLGLPYSTFAEDGARARDLVARQLAALDARAPDGRYDLGCLYIGVNDVRALDFDPQAFARDHLTALHHLKARCDQVLAVTIPQDLGRPKAGHTDDGNAIIRANAATARALVLDLRDFRGRNLVMADHVHPTAFGQIAIAERALALLERHGLAVKVRPSQLIGYETTRRGRLRGDLTYAYRHAKTSARAAAIRSAVRAGWAPRAARAAAADTDTTGTAADRTPASP
jgi:lysophospholipase L1-like esterase